MPTTLSILVFVASPLDYARYRHTALYFEFDETERIQKDTADADADTNGIQSEPPENTKSCVMEIVGSPGFFSFSERLNWGIPATSSGELDYSDFHVYGLIPILISIRSRTRDPRFLNLRLGITLFTSRDSFRNHYTERPRRWGLE